MTQASIPSFHSGKLSEPARLASPRERQLAAETTSAPPLAVIGGLSGAAIGGVATLVIAATGAFSDVVMPFAVMGFGTVGAALAGALLGLLLAPAAQPAPART